MRVLIGHLTHETRVTIARAVLINRAFELREAFRTTKFIEARDTFIKAVDHY